MNYYFFLSSFFLSLYIDLAQNKCRFRWDPDDVCGRLTALRLLHSIAADTSLLVRKKRLFTLLYLDSIRYGILIVMKPIITGGEQSSVDIIKIYQGSDYGLMRGPRDLPRPVLVCMSSYARYRVSWLNGGYYIVDTRKDGCHCLPNASILLCYAMMPLP